MEARVKRPPGRPSEGAREAIVAAARELFAERGFEGTSLADVVAKSGVSKGALYHHFGSKLALFEAVYMGVEDGFVQRLVAAVGEGSPLERLRAGSRAYLAESAGDGDFVRISLRQSRGVLGHERWRQIATERGLGVVEAVLAAAVEAGEVRPLPAHEAAAVYLGALIEAGLLVAGADEKAPAQRASAEVLDRMLDGLAGPGD